MSDDPLSQLTSTLAQEPSQRERAEHLFRDVLRAAGDFKGRADPKALPTGDVMVEMEKLEEALLFFKGLSNKYYDMLFQLQRLIQERRMAPALGLRLLEKRSANARPETPKT